MYQKQYTLLNNCSKSHIEEHNTPLTCATQLNQNCLMPRNNFQRQVDQNTILSMKSFSRGNNSIVSFQELSLNNNKWIVFDTFTPLESDRYKRQNRKIKMQNSYCNNGSSRLGSAFLKRLDKQNNKNIQQLNEKGTSLFQGKQLNQFITESRTHIAKINAKTTLQQIKSKQAIKKDEASRRDKNSRIVQLPKTARKQPNTANLSKNILLTSIKNNVQLKNAAQFTTSLFVKNEQNKCLATISNDKSAPNQPQASLSACTYNRKDQKQQTEQAEQNNQVIIDTSGYIVLAQFYDKAFLLQPNLTYRPYTDNPNQQFDPQQNHQHTELSPQHQSLAKHNIENIPVMDSTIQKQKIAQIKKWSFNTKETNNMIASIVSNPLQQLAAAAPTTNSVQNLPQADPSPQIQLHKSKYSELNMQELFLAQQNIHFINIEPCKQTSLLPRQLSPPIYIKSKVTKTKSHIYHNEELVNWLNLLLKVKPENIHQIFLPFQKNQYSCNLYEQGKSIVVNVDGHLPFSVNLFPLYGTIGQYIWFGVLLKALAKLNNSYKAINNLNFRYICKTIINKDLVSYELDKQDKEAVRQLRKLIGLCRKGSLFVVAVKQNMFYKVNYVSYSKSLSQKQQDRQKIIINQSLGITKRDYRSTFKTLDDFLNKKKKELNQKRIIKNTRIHLLGVDSNIKITIDQLRTDYQLYSPQSLEPALTTTDHK